MGAPRIRKNDVVVARSGNDRGKTGKVLSVDVKAGRVLVEGLNIVKKTVRKSEAAPQGGIVEKEAAMSLSVLMLHCPNCKKGVRTRRFADGDRRARKCARCGHMFEN